MDEHQLPPHLTAAARLGAAKELKQVVIVVIGNATREAYLAEDCGNKPLVNSGTKWTDPWKVIARKQGSQGIYHGRRYAMDQWDGVDAALRPKKRKTERVFKVVEHLGSMPEGARSTVLMHAESIGIPIWNWPGERLPYRVEGLEGDT